MRIFDAIRRWMGTPPGGDGGGPDSAGEGPEMIPCEEALARVYEYLDGELEGVTHEQVEAHFRICTRCYPHLKLENRFRDALHRAVEGQAAPPELKERVLALMEEEGA